MGFLGRLFGTKREENREQLKSSSTSASTDNTDEYFVYEPETDVETSENKKNKFFAFFQRKKSTSVQKLTEKQIKSTTRGDGSVDFTLQDDMKEKEGYLFLSKDPELHKHFEEEAGKYSGKASEDGIKISTNKKGIATIAKSIIEKLKGIVKGRHKDIAQAEPEKIEEEQQEAERKRSEKKEKKQMEESRRGGEQRTWGEQQSSDFLKSFDKWIQEQRETNLAFVSDEDFCRLFLEIAGLTTNQVFGNGKDATYSLRSPKTGEDIILLPASYDENNYRNSLTYLEGEITYAVPFFDNGKWTIRFGQHNLQDGIQGEKIISGEENKFGHDIAHSVGELVAYGYNEYCRQHKKQFKSQSQVKKSEERIEETKETRKNTSEENKKGTQAETDLKSFETYVDDEMENRKKDTGRPEDIQKYLSDQEVVGLLSDFTRGIHTEVQKVDLKKHHRIERNDNYQFEWDEEDMSVFLLKQSSGETVVLLSPTGDKYDGENDYRKQLAEFEEQYKKEHSDENLSRITFAVPYNLEGKTEEGNHWVMKYGRYDMSKGQIIEVKEANSLANGKQTDGWSCGYHTVKACAELATYGYEEFDAMEKARVRNQGGEREQQEKKDEELAMMLNEMQKEAEAIPLNETEQSRYESMAQSPDTDWSWSDEEEPKKTEQLDPSTFDSRLATELDKYKYTSMSFGKGTDGFMGLLHQNGTTGNITVILPASDDEGISRGRIEQIKDSYPDDQVTFVMPYYHDDQWQVTVVNHNGNLNGREDSLSFSNSNYNSSSFSCLGFIVNYAKDDCFDDFVLARTNQSRIIPSEERDKRGYKYCYIQLENNRRGLLCIGIPNAKGTKEELYSLTEETLEISKNNYFFKPRGGFGINGQTHFYMQYIAEDGSTCYAHLEPLANRNEQGGVTGWYSFSELSITETIGTKKQEKEGIEEAKRKSGEIKQEPEEVISHSVSPETTSIAQPAPQSSTETTPPSTPATTEFDSMSESEEEWPYAYCNEGNTFNVYIIDGNELKLLTIEDIESDPSNGEKDKIRVKKKKISECSKFRGYIFSTNSELDGKSIDKTTAKTVGGIEYDQPRIIDGYGIALKPSSDQTTIHVNDIVRKELKKLAGTEQKRETRENRDQEIERKRKEEEERKRQEEEAEKKRLAEEAEKKRLAEEAEKKRLAEEAEKKRLAEEAEKKRLAEEAEKKRLAEEAEKKRLAEEAEKKRLAEEAEKKRLAEETERKRLEEEAEKKRKQEEEEKPFIYNVKNGEKAYDFYIYAIVGEELKQLKQKDIVLRKGGSITFSEEVLAGQRKGYVLSTDPKLTEVDSTFSRNIKDFRYNQPQITEHGVVLRSISATIDISKVKDELGNFVNPKPDERIEELGLSDNEELTEDGLNNWRERTPSGVVYETPEEKKMRIEEERKEQRREEKKQVQEERVRLGKKFYNMKKQYTNMEQKTRYRQKLFQACFKSNTTSMGQAVYNAATVARKLLEMNGGDKKYQNTYNIAKDFFNTCFKQDGIDIREVAEGAIDLQELISSNKSGIEKRYQKDIKRIVINSFIDSCFENSDKIGKQNSEETSYRDLFNYTALETSRLIQYSDFGDKQQEKASKIRKYFFKKELKIYKEKIEKETDLEKKKELFTYVAESVLHLSPYYTLEESTDTCEEPEVGEKIMNYNTVVKEFTNTCKTFGVDDEIISTVIETQKEQRKEAEKQRKEAEKQRKEAERQRKQRKKEKEKEREQKEKEREQKEKEREQKEHSNALSEIKPVSEDTGNSCYCSGMPQNRNNQRKGRS